MDYKNEVYRLYRPFYENNIKEDGFEIVIRIKK